MSEVLLFLIISIFVSATCADILGPKYVPTKGEVWPKPKKENRSKEYYTFSPSQFKTKILDKSCEILTRAIDRYSYLIQKDNEEPWSSSVHEQNQLHLGSMDTLEVTLTEPCEEQPSYGMDESYILDISSTSQLKSASVWGILRGLETFSQLIYYSDNYKQARINKNSIEDSPSYIHRGLLLDTARHYISMQRILDTLDAMSYNKMNVFHWHMVDDQSFPYNSEKYPELSEKGAFDQSKIYTKGDIQRVIEYARDRGIRVIPEFDVPGHSRSWGKAFPNILTECNGALGAMDPTKEETYDLIVSLYAELKTVFPDEYLHIGGDEVDQKCWRNNAGVQAFLEEKGIKIENLQNFFMKTLIAKLNTTKLMVWEDAFNNQVALPKDTLVQIWWFKDYETKIKNVVEAGLKVIFSERYYLDRLGNDWASMYKWDPREQLLMIYKSLNVENIVGGEACMWTEEVDDDNVMCRVWPRAIATAERFWSAVSDNDFIQAEVYKRYEEQAWRMIRRGIEAASPDGPGLC